MILTTLYIYSIYEREFSMTASAFLNDYLAFSTEEDSVKSFDYTYCSTPSNVEDYGKIFKQTTLSIKKFANAYYKTTTMIEPRDIEQIKVALNNYACKDVKVKEFKRELIEDLTAFQNQINTNYKERIAENKRKKQICERQIQVLEVEKNKLIMDRLSRIEWPYDSKTKEYDTKIAMFELQATQFGQKAEQMQQMRPMANEKEILIYELKLKEKFACLIK